MAVFYLSSGTHTRLSPVKETNIHAVTFVILTFTNIKMGIGFLIFFVLFVSSIASVVTQNTSGFHHFWLVQSWPPVFCQKYPCKNPPLDFVLHGLWPVNSSGHTLKNSSRGKFDFVGTVLPLLF